MESETFLTTKTKDGKEVKVFNTVCTGLVLISCLEDGTPVASTVLTDDGELRAEMRAEDFRNNKDLTNFRIGSVRWLIMNGKYNPVSGQIYGYVPYDNKVSQAYWEKMGVHTEPVEINGRNLIRYFNYVEEEILGLVKVK